MLYGLSKLTSRKSKGGGPYSHPKIFELDIFVNNISHFKVTNTLMANLKKKSRLIPRIEGGAESASNFVNLAY